ncbi:Gcd10p family-domain-containing protein [Whalleya microplaca]|nr:Gcd10p family-domain-containing protein [Whalleya microplaca]
MHSLVQPNAWVVLKLPSGNLRVLQVTPNTTISLGKYGSFPSNLIIHRPYHLTYELQDKLPHENFSRLRIVPASELYADILSSSAPSGSSEEATPVPDGEDVPTGVEYTLVDPDSGAVVATTDRAELDASARQTLSMEEIEALKKDGTDAGKDLIAKLMLSHTAIDQKTQYSLAKYKLLKTKKYIRRFSVLPLDVPLLDHWQLEEKDSSKILDMREEMIALLGCWANVHFGGEDRCENEEASGADDKQQWPEQTPGRWLVVDDTGGLLVAAMAERMGILYPPETTAPEESGQEPTSPNMQRGEAPSEPKTATSADTESPQLENQDPTTTQLPLSPSSAKKPPQSDAKQRHDDLHVPYAHANTLTVLHANSQPNLSFLRHYAYDATNPSQTPDHPLASHLMTLSWLQLASPDLDGVYASKPPAVSPETLRSWKANRRGTYHRKRRRWARTRHVVDATRRGGFAGLVVASVMDPVSVLRRCVPLLAGGAPIAVYAPSVEPLAALADCYSIARRAAWVSNPPTLPQTPSPQTTTTAPPTTTEEGGQNEDKTGDLEHWEGNASFPLNPSLVLGASVQTSRVRRWQVLPGRTHPLMTGRGGPEGYVFTAWRVRPAEGRVEARGKGRARKRKAGEVVGE